MRKIGFAILGTGMIARFHGRAIADLPDASLLAVCSRSQERAGEFAAEFGCRAFTNLDEMLALPELDVLVIATPSGAHLEPALAAARAGKHVLCEKPLEITLERIDAMIEAHRAAGTQLGCTFQIRYTPALEPLRAALAAGRFGTLTYAGVYVPWWRAPEYYSESSWHGTQALDGGGALINQAIHMIDLLCDVMPPVERVAGFVNTVGHPGIEAEDVATAALFFKGGALGFIYGSTSQWPGYAKRLEIAGTRGSAILVDDRLERFDFLDSQPEDLQALRDPGQSGAGASAPGAMSHALHTACFGDFATAIRSGRPYGIDGASARRSVEIIQAIYTASRTGQTVQLGID